MDYPTSPIAAVTHPNPYPYYAGLVEYHPFEYNSALGMWVAASAEAIAAVLTSSACRVRPLSEPIPKALEGSPAREIFRHLVRMNDGDDHHTVKRAVSSALMSVDMVGQAAKRWAEVLFNDLHSDRELERLSDFAFQLPVCVMGSLLGIQDDELPQTAVYISEFVACLAPGSSPEQLERGKLAAENLLTCFQSLLTDPHGKGLLHRLAREVTAEGRGSEQAIVANAIGFLTQAYDATAGLIGNMLAALACHDGLYQQVMNYPELLVAAAREVLRHDSPVQNTRRFLAENCVLAGQSVRQGDAVLVLLAAANRDPAANPRPDHFDLARKERRLFTFGLGAHACPGENLAVTIATAGVQQLLASGLDPRRLRWTYRPSANARIPIFASAGD
jgi:cytochrome P450